jgi:hypothetical protein
LGKQDGLRENKTGNACVAPTTEMALTIWAPGKQYGL